jgi:uncharacterized OB-fold protein
MTIEGSECRCGFRTISLKPTCPRCGRTMEQRKFFDEGKVLSYVSLKVKPEDYGEPMDLAMVEIDNGPRLVCWTNETLKAEQRIRVYLDGVIIRCKTP